MQVLTRHLEVAVRPSTPALRALTVTIALAGLTGASLAVIGPPSPAHADSVIVVDSTSQVLGLPGCTLSEAILAANQDASQVQHPLGDGQIVDTGCAAGEPGTDVIELAPGGDYAFDAVMNDAFNHVGPTATPIVTSHIIIEGRGAVIRRAGTLTVRAFAVQTGGNLDLREVHVKDFAARGGNGAGGGGGGLGAGGAIYVNNGTLLVQWSTFSANSATGGNGSTDGPVLRWRRWRPRRRRRHQALERGSSRANGGGGGGSRGDGGGVGDGGGGGTVADGDVGGYRCGGPEADGELVLQSDHGYPGSCPGGGGGGGGPLQGAVVFSGDGGDGNYGAGGGGGGYDTGDGGDGGFGGAGGSGPAFGSVEFGFSGGSGGDGGFGGGGGSGPGGVIGGPGVGGTFAGDGGDIHGGGGAGLGGAIFAHSSSVTVINSTFTGNFVVRGVAGGNGAQNGADAGGAIFAVGGSLTVTNATIARNESTGNGAGLVVYKPTTGEATLLALHNTIIAENTGVDECGLRGGVAATGTGNLVIPHDADSLDPCPGIASVWDPNLFDLALNAPGKTPTMALPATGPALDAGDLSVAPADDQRGVPRPQLGGVDIGAFEYDPTIDTTAPTASPTASPAANAAGWNTTDVTVAWNWTDEPGGSGIDASACTTSSGSSGEGGALALSATCADLTGNVGSAQTTVKVDKTAPGVTCDATPSYVVGSTPAGGVSATVTDELSGPAASPVTATVTAGNVAVAGVGEKSLTGADLAGNTTTVDCAYVVAYGFSGFLQPIPQSSYKRASTIPVRFQLQDASGSPISDQAAGALLSPACRVMVTFDGQAKGCASYNSRSNTFQFDLKTSKASTAGLHTVGILVTTALGDVLNSQSAQVRLR